MNRCGNQSEFDARICFGDSLAPMFPKVDYSVAFLEKGESENKKSNKRTDLLQTWSEVIG